MNAFLRKRPSRLRLALGGAATAVCLFAFALPAVGSDGTEFLCEEAVAHIASCCPHFDPTTIECSYTISCDASVNPNPELTAAQSRCIEQLSCSALQATAACQGVQQQAPAGTSKMVGGLPC